MTAVPPVNVPVNATITTKTVSTAVLPRIVVELVSLLSGAGALAASAYSILEGHISHATPLGLGGAAILVAHVLSRVTGEATVAKAQVAKYGPDAEKVLQTVETDVPDLGRWVGELETDVKGRLTKLETNPAVVDVEGIVKRAAAGAADLLTDRVQTARAAAAAAASATPVPPGVVAPGLTASDGSAMAGNSPAVPPAA